MINSVRILVRLVLNRNFSEIIKRCCATLIAIGCIIQPVYKGVKTVAHLFQITRFHIMYTYSYICTYVNIYIYTNICIPAHIIPPACKGVKTVAHLFQITRFHYAYMYLHIYIFIYVHMYT